MSTRLRALLLLVLIAALAAAVMTTCESPEHAVPEPDVVAEPVVEVPAKDVVVPRVERRRTPRAPPQRPAEVESEEPEQLEGSSVTVGSFYVGSPVQEPDPPPPMGRVHALFLKDGEPFQGGHVCFYPAEFFAEVTGWDGVQTSHGAYGGVPLDRGLWPGYDPVLATGLRVGGFARERAVTGADGRVWIDIPADREYVVFVRYASDGMPLRTNPRVRVEDGGEVSVTIEAATQRRVRGTVVDHLGKPLVGVAVQAISPVAERPLSWMVASGEGGAFELRVFGDDAAVRVRAVAIHGTRALAIVSSAEAALAALPPGDVTIAGVVPDGPAPEIRMQPEPGIVLELTVPEGTPRLHHCQVESMAFVPDKAAWGRLGGPKYVPLPDAEDGDRMFIGVPESLASRPLMLWTWGRTITAIDPRGRESLSVEIPAGRLARVEGDGWQGGDLLRVVVFCPFEGRELPCVWLEDGVGGREFWERNDSPPWPIEFQLVRDGKVVARSERVPAGSGTAKTVELDAPVPGDE